MSTQRVRHYVEFFSRGTLFDETSVREVESRDPSLIQLPNGAFGFQFFDVIEAAAIGYSNLMLRSDPIERSKMYYVGGRVMTLEEVKAEMPDADTLIRNMEGNDYERVIRTSQGNFRVFSDEDAVLLEPN